MISLVALVRDATTQESDDLPHRLLLGLDSPAGTGAELDPADMRGLVVMMGSAAMSVTRLSVGGDPAQHAGDEDQLLSRRSRLERLRESDNAPRQRKRVPHARLVTEPLDKHPGERQREGEVDSAHRLGVADPVHARLDFLERRHSFLLLGGERSYPSTVNVMVEPGDPDPTRTGTWKV